jgi:tetratricopeptide (TPR) repeat protein
MPSHIFYRMGDMREAIRANKAAIEADESYFAEEPNLYRPDGDRYRYAYYPHNIHFVIAAAALGGDNNDVNQYAEKLLHSAPDKANGLRADLYRAAYYLTRMNFSSPADIREFPKPDSLNQQPLANVAYDFTQLMADIWSERPFDRSAGKFDTDLVNYRKAADKPNAACDKAPRPRGKLCLAAILDDLRHARVEALTSNWEKAVGAARHAIAIQAALSDEFYDEPPLWPYPVRQTLASVLIRKALAEDPNTGREDLDNAKQELLESLNMNKSPDGNPNRIPTGSFPGNGWAYYGLWEIANHDDSSRAEMLQAWNDLNDHWFGAPEFHTLDRL